MTRTRLLSAAIALASLLAVRADAAPIVYDGFDYATGALSGQNGGTGDWKSVWSGDSDLGVASGGWSYTDSNGWPLSVEGNHIGLASGSDIKKAERQLNGTLGSATETVWLSFIFEGSTGSAVNNFSLGDGLFVGQGSKDSGGTNLWLSDQDGLTGVSATSQSFLVARVDFQSGNEGVWLWIDPVLNAEPDTLFADANGSAKDFSTDFVRAQLSDTAAGMDELRIGYFWFDIFETPEPSTALLLGFGLSGLSLHARRQRSASARRSRTPIA
jgi:hypothetical protein